MTYLKLIVATGVLCALMTMSVSAAVMPTLKVGDTLPDFKLPYATRDTVVLDGIGKADLAGQRFVIASYPADFSPGCTKEMCSFRDGLQQFEQLKVTVLPVSGDLVFAHREFAKQQNLPFKLLSDPKREFGRHLGVLILDQGILRRSVFVFGPDGVLEYVDYDYSVKDDADFTALKAFLAAKK
jgi:peroxiredoxin